MENKSKDFNNPCERCSNYGCPDNPYYDPVHYSRNPFQEAQERYYRSWDWYWNNWID